MRLPEHQDDEDFVEDRLQLGDDILRIYHEHSLGYLRLSTDSREILSDIAGVFDRA